MQNDGRGLVKLSLKERQVLRLLCEGLQHKEIAMRLKISVNTVASYVCEIRAAIGNSTGLLAVWAMQHEGAFRGEWVDREIHKPGCRCKGPVCSILEDAAA